MQYSQKPKIAEATEAKILIAEYYRSADTN